MAKICGRATFAGGRAVSDHLEQPLFQQSCQVMAGIRRRHLERLAKLGDRHRPVRADVIQDALADRFHVLNYNPQS